MNLYDQHLHSDVSHDCTQWMGDYLQQAYLRGDTAFVTTEHLDLSCSTEDNRDIIPDFQQQKKLLASMQEKYPSIDLRMGIEVGYKASASDTIRRILQSQPFDLVVLSIHDDEVANVGGPGFLSLGTAQEAYVRYLTLCLEAVQEFDDFDTLGHIDFLLRYSPPVDLAPLKPVLESIFKVLIEKDKCLELNTRFLYQQQDSGYLSYILQQYKACGGQKLTIGSDAHHVANFQGGFSEAVSLLRQCGFDTVWSFKQRQGTPMLIDG